MKKLCLPSPFRCHNTYNHIFIHYIKVIKEIICNIYHNHHIKIISKTLFFPGKEPVREFKFFRIFCTKWAFHHRKNPDFQTTNGHLNDLALFLGQALKGKKFNFMHNQCCTITRPHWDSNPSRRLRKPSGYPSYLMRALFDYIDHGHLFQNKMPIFSFRDCFYLIFLNTKLPKRVHIPFKNRIISD